MMVTKLVIEWTESGQKPRLQISPNSVERHLSESQSAKCAFNVIKETKFSY